MTPAPELPGGGQGSTSGSLVEKPPRERPRPSSSRPLFCSGGVLVRADYGGIDHLDAVMAGSGVVERLEHHVSHPDSVQRRNWR